MSVEPVLNKPHVICHDMCHVPCAVLESSLDKDDFKVRRDSLYAEIISFIRQIATVRKTRQTLRLLTVPLFLPTVSANLILLKKKKVYPMNFAFLVSLGHCGYTTTILKSTEGQGIATYFIYFNVLSHLGRHLGFPELCYSWRWQNWVLEEQGGFSDSYLAAFLRSTKVQYIQSTSEFFLFVVVKGRTTALVAGKEEESSAQVVQGWGWTVGQTIKKVA